MKTLSILCALVMVCFIGVAQAQQYEAAPAGTTAFAGQIDIAPHPNTVDVDFWLTGVGAPQSSGGIWLDWTGSAGVIDFVTSSGDPADSDAIGFTGPWTPVSGVVEDAGGPDTMMVTCANLAGADPAAYGGNLPIVRVTFQTLGTADATINMTTIPATTTWNPLADGSVTPGAVVIHQVCDCLTDADCDDSLDCNGAETCVDCACLPGTPLCDDDDDCTLNECDEDTLECSYPCDVEGLSGPTDECCETEPCSADPICASQVTLIKEDGYYQPPGVDQVATIKNKICMLNPEDLVGGIQFDLCDVPDCLECIDCELTERTVMFDCVVLELPDGCCRVILFCKNPGCAINPGECDIVTVVMQTKEGAPEECGEDCIIETFGNIVVSDYDGNALAGAGLGEGALCPVVCGDVCPPGSGAANDCGDGVVDIYDIMCEVDFALTATTPNDCQAPRADVPTGTPPDCAAPDGNIDILDIMVLIDMALDRQDCCSFYYLGIIY
jgi:hypothetical protein